MNVRIVFTFILGITLVLVVMVFITGAYKIGNNIFGEMVWRVDTDEKVVYLTIDDGPTIYTDMILRALIESGVNATFFVTGENVKNHPDITSRIVQDNNQIGNHGNSHSQMQFMWKNQQEEELVNSAMWINKAVGVEPKLFRPPYLRRNPLTFQVTEKYENEVIGCTENLYDWELPGPSVIVERVLDSVSPGYIICLHDGEPAAQTAEIINILVPELKDRGYSFEVL